MRLRSVFAGLRPLHTARPHRAHSPSQRHFLPVIPKKKSSARPHVAAAAGVARQAGTLLFAAESLPGPAWYDLEPPSGPAAGDHAAAAGAAPPQLRLDVRMARFAGVPGPERYLAF